MFTKDKTCAEHILDQLRGKDSLAGGVLEDNVRDIAGFKSSTVSRIARDMAEAGKIQKGYFMVNKKKCVFYRLKTNV